MPSLVRHPETPPGAILSIDADLDRFADGAIATFRLRGDISKLVIPPSVKPGRADDLWRTTCFELFISADSAGYREYNFSPSGLWAAYEFDDYRSGMRNIPAEIETEIFMPGNGLHFTAKIRAEFPNPAQVGLTAVIEEVDGAISYWASAFAPGKPDFHAAAVRSLLFDGVSAE